MTGPKHVVDPDTIEVGQEAHFVCPVGDCGMNYWYIWQPSDAVTTFGVTRCRMHEEMVLMGIDEVRDRVDT